MTLMLRASFSPHMSRPNILNTFNNYIKPVCLAAQNSVFSAGTSSWITGWGDVQCSVSLAAPGILQETMVPVVDNTRCNNLLGSGSVTSNMICAGLTQGGKDTCQVLVVAHRTSRCARLLLSHRGVAVLLISSWVLGLVSFAPLWPVYVFTPQVCTCSFHRTKGRPYTTVLLFMYFFLGLGCVGLFYFLIYRKVSIASKAFLKYRPSRHSSKRKRAEAEGTTDDSGISAGASTTQSCEISNEGTGAEQHKDRAQEGQTTTQESKTSISTIQISPNGVETSSKPAPVAVQITPAANSGEDNEFKRVTRMCFTVFLCFVGCFAPFLLLNVADKANRAPQVVHMICANLTWLNSCINPLLYAAMNRQFNQAYKDLLGKALHPLTWIWRTHWYTLK